MWTNNWKKWQLSQWAGQTGRTGTSSTSYWVEYPAPILAIDGVTSIEETAGFPSDLGGANVINGYFIPYISFKSAAVFFGTGTRAVAADDYALEAPLTSEQISVSSNISFDESTLQYQFITTIKNLTSESLTINEVALYKRVNASSYSSMITAPSITTINNNKQYIAMLYREVLETPILMESGQSKTIIMTLSL